MNISSLSIQDKRRLSELLEDLIDILNRKDSLIENASKEIDRMSVIDDMQTKLDEKSSELTSISTPIDAKELQGLVEKSDKLSSEKEEINLKSKKINDDLEELENIEKSLMEDINEILFTNKEKEVEEKGIFIDSMNTSVFIEDKQLPETKEKVSSEDCEIINCNIELIVEIAKLYRSNINKIILSTDESGFDELKEKVEKYKNEKNNSYDKQLELLRNSFKKEEPEIQEEEKEEPVEQKEEISEEQPIVQEITPEEPANEVIEPVQQEENIININEQPIIQEEIPVETPINLEVNNESVIPLEEPVVTPQPDDTVVPISTLLEQQLMMPQEEVTNTATLQQEEPKVEQNAKFVTINFDEKVVPNKLVAATKEKLNNKILDICWGSFEPRKFVYENSKSNDMTNFSLDKFVKDTAA